MPNFSYTHTYTARQGESRYIEPLPRGHAEIYEDNARHVYDLRGVRQPRLFRAWAKEIFVNGGDGTYRLIGSYPRYHVERAS